MSSSRSRPIISNLNLEASSVFFSLSSGLYHPARSTETILLKRVWLHLGGQPIGLPAVVADVPSAGEPSAVPSTECQLHLCRASAGTSLRPWLQPVGTRAGSHTLSARFSGASPSMHLSQFRPPNTAAPPQNHTAEPASGLPRRSQAGYSRMEGLVMPQSLAAGSPEACPGSHPRVLPFMLFMGFMVKWGERKKGSRLAPRRA